MNRPDPQLAMPVLFRQEDIVLVLPPELAHHPVRVSIDSAPRAHAGVGGSAGSLIIGNTSERPDGSYPVEVDVGGDAISLTFEVTHDLFRRSRCRFGRPEIVAHRGGKSDAPENTLTALRWGMARADAVEFDVRLTWDHELVVMHDDTVDRTTEATGRVADLTLAEMRSLTTGREPVPTLSEVLEGLGERGRAQVHVKLEEDEERTESLLTRVAAVLRHHAWEERCTVLATKPRAIGILEHNPRLHLDIDIGAESAETVISRIGAGLLGESGHRLKTSDFLLPDSAPVGVAHGAGVPMVCWARDSSNSSVERLLRLAVDSVMTDYPEQMAPIIDRLEQLAGV